MIQIVILLQLIGMYKRLLLNISMKSNLVNITENDFVNITGSDLVKITEKFKD